MNLEPLSRHDSRLKNLLQQAQQWQRLDENIKKILPANLRSHFQTACIRNGTLILLAANNMAASRLKMILPSLLQPLQQLDHSIHDVRVSVLPKPPAVVKSNTLKLSPAALQNFEETAEKLQESHPQLAQRLMALVKKHL